MLHVLYVPSERRTEPASVTPLIMVSRPEARGTVLRVDSLIVERLADGILGVKHGVAAFVIQFLACYYYAATCCCRSPSSGR